MKNIFTALILFLGIGANAQDLNKTIEDPNRHKQVMLNLCTRDSVTSFPEFKASYDANYENYKVDSASVAQITKLMKGKKVTIVLGTWCGDSKYQVPNFLKIMDAAKISEENLKFIGVDGMKKAENGLIDSLNITRVPTFIFTDKKGKEVARITERPTETLEKDMLKLLAVQPKKVTAKTK